jgi:predicted RNA binding protein YcfA (HicA-like mRNA interferase family)
MQLRTVDSTVTVPVPNHKELRIGTLRAIIRQSNLPPEAFVRQL